MKNFFKRRLVRLHPMVVLGAVLGAITFFIQGSVQWDGSHVATSLVMVALLCVMFFIPAVPGAGYEVRGNGEMFPLNGPAWSLFFEYIGNIFYALFIHKFSTKALTVMVVILGIALTMFACSDAAGYGSIGVGWTLDGVNFVGGLLRMLFPFSMGMLLSRCFKPVKIRGAFWICSIVLLILFHIPFVEGSEPILMNGVFEMFCIIFVFRRWYGWEHRAALQIKHPPVSASSLVIFLSHFISSIIRLCICFMLGSSRMNISHWVKLGR